MSSWRHRISIALMSALVLGGACHKSEQADVEPAATPLRLTVVSHHQSDVVINLIHDRITERIGTVAPGTTQTFTVPAHRLGPSRMFQLAALHLGATQGYVTEALSVDSGQEILWTLDKYLASSVVHIR